ncbi:MAG: sigma-70 family RNA polymerase sigma factor [Calditrichia bacterium]|nr:sigma-70 family RNA polymerase sigma factor [Calditrichia bacterium]
MKSQDSELISKAKSGDEYALEELLGKYKIAVYNLVYRMVKDKQEAEDLTQETFIKTFKSLPSFNEEYAFSTWIFKIATNNCIDFFRKRKLKTYSIDKPIQYKTSEIQQDHPDTDPNAEKSMLAEERSELIKKAIDSLPKKYNEAIVLRHMKEKSYEEIAEMLNLPLGTVKARIFRAREMLNKALKEKLSGY